MPLIKVNETQRRVLIIAILLAVVASFMFLRMYLMLIIFSGIMAYLFGPIHDRLLKRGQSQGAAAVNTFLISVLVIIVPAAIILTITVFQIENLVSDLAKGNYSSDAQSLGNAIVDFTNNTLAQLGIDKTVTVQQLADSISSALSTFGKSLLEGLLSSISGFFALITTSIIYIYVFMSMLKNKSKIISTIKRLNPLGDEVSELYLDRVGSMTKATVRGQFIIALMQGAESAFVISLFAGGDLFFFLLLFLTLLSLIPLGAGIVTIPIGIFMMLTGNVWQGAVVIANHLLIVTNIDNVMRPKLVPKNARLDPALMILAVFAGVALFGFIGIVIGPIIMILLVTTLQIFLEVFHSIESIDRNKYTKPMGRIARLRKRFRIGS